ncbi:MAG TPA: hypothetical protein VJ927_10095 [Actinomycetota bacterium]|nr:hypothetical protein [Actinomycetota bacterium]
MEEIKGWFAGRLPDEWFEEAPTVETDREEILVVGTLADVDLGSDATPDAVAAARAARIERFREDTRRQRMAIASEAQHRFRRKVSWGARCGDVEYHFTTLALPVMTRLRKREREVLDTLVSSGVARSRSHALAWCVRLVGQNQEEWIGKLRDALSEVEKVRAEGPA